MRAQARAINYALFALFREVPSLTFEVGSMRAQLAARGLGSFRCFAYDEQVAAFAPPARGPRHGVSQDVAVASRD